MVFFTVLWLGWFAWRCFSCCSWNYQYHSSWCVRCWKKSSLPDAESSPCRRQNTVNHPNHQLSFAIHRFNCRASHINCLSIEITILTFLVFHSLVGAITRRLKCIKIYFAILLIHLIASFGTGGFAIRATFRDSPRFENDCRSGSGEQSVIEGCHQAALMLRFFVLSAYLVAWLLSMCKFPLSILFFCGFNHIFSGAGVIVFKFMRQLSDEEKAKSAMKSTEAW